MYKILQSLCSSVVVGLVEVIKNLNDLLTAFNCTVLLYPFLCFFLVDTRKDKIFQLKDTFYTAKKDTRTGILINIRFHVKMSMPSGFLSIPFGGKVTLCLPLSAKEK